MSKVTVHAHCLTCKQRREVTGTITEKGGRKRIVGECSQGHKVNAFVSKGAGESTERKQGSEPASTPRRERKPRTRKEGDVSKRGGGGGGGGDGETNVTGARAMRVSIPVEVATNPRISAAWDIMAGFIEGCLCRHITQPQAVALRAAAMKAAAKGNNTKADSTELNFGRALAQVFPYVLIDMGITPQAFLGMMPPELLAYVPEVGGQPQAPQSFIQGFMQGFSGDQQGGMMALPGFPGGLGSLGMQTPGVGQAGNPTGTAEGGGMPGWRTGLEAGLNAVLPNFLVPDLDADGQDASGLGILFGQNSTPQQFGAAMSSTLGQAAGSALQYNLFGSPMNGGTLR